MKSDSMVFPQFRTRPVRDESQEVTTNNAKLKQQWRPKRTSPSCCLHSIRAKAPTAVTEYRSQLYTAASRNQKDCKTTTLEHCKTATLQWLYRQRRRLPIRASIIIRFRPVDFNHNKTNRTQYSCQHSTARYSYQYSAT